jgi:hypothetical protein
MQRHKHFAWAWAAAGLFAVSGLLGACDPAETTNPKPDTGTQDAGTQADAGTQTDAGTRTDAGTQPPTDAGTQTDAGSTAVLPLAVDGTWAASGYMGDGEHQLIKDEAQCAEPRPGSGLGNCHRFTWTPGGAGKPGWGGVWWQYPEGNWGNGTPKVPGFEVPKGASSVSFYAWGTTGDEKVTFLVGMGPAVDGFELKLVDVPLTTTPKQYTIDVSGIAYGKVVGGFGWVAGGRTSPLVFSIDDIQWR